MGRLTPACPGAARLRKSRYLTRYGALLITIIGLCATPGAARAAGDDYLQRGRRGLAGAGGGASRATTVASHARACGDVSQASAASAM